MDRLRISCFKLAVNSTRMHIVVIRFLLLCLFSFPSHALFRFHFLLVVNSTRMHIVVIRVLLLCLLSFPLPCWQFGRAVGLARPSATCLRGSTSSISDWSDDEDSSISVLNVNALTRTGHILGHQMEYSAIK
jgi:hypothetical protein